MHFADDDALDDCDDVLGLLHSPHPAVARTTETTETTEQQKQQKQQIVSMNASTKNDGKDDEQKLTTTDSKEYYAGFLNSPLGDISVDNSSSESSNSKRRDSIAPTLKFAMNSTAVVLVLLLAFFASNGLLF